MDFDFLLVCRSNYVSHLYRFQDIYYNFIQEMAYVTANVKH